MERFDIRDFLSENKLTDTSKRLDETKTDVHLSGTFEGDGSFERKLTRPAEEFSFTPVDAITVDKLVSEWSDDFGYLRIEFSNGDHIQYETERGKSSSSMEVLGNKSKNDSMFLKNMDNTDSPTYTALEIYKKLVKNMSR